MKTNFLSGARGEDILCHARVLKFGRRLIYGVGRVPEPGRGCLFQRTATIT